MSENLEKKLIQFGVPQDLLSQFLKPKPKPKTKAKAKPKQPKPKQPKKTKKESGAK